MNDTTRMLVETAERILGDICTKDIVDSAESGDAPEVLSRAFDENGLLWATAAEADGGAELDLADAFALLRPIGRFAAPLPLPETLLIGALTRASGLPLPSRPALAVAQDAQYPKGVAAAGALSIEGKVTAVPWARKAETFVTVVQTADGLALAAVSASDVRVEQGANAAGEPRDTIELATEVDATRWRPLPPGLDPRALAALGRSVLMAGAIDSILEMSVRYVLERKQFGRALSEFQAIQHHLAVLAGEAAAAVRASDGGLHALGTASEHVSIAAAKARVGEAAGAAASIAHQVHGAMGFTYEHPLHQRTRRLWSWREEYGNEPVWNAMLGRRIAAVGADAVWELIAGR